MGEVRWELKMHKDRSGQSNVCAASVHLRGLSCLMEKINPVNFRVSDFLPNKRGELMEQENQDGEKKREVFQEKKIKTKQNTVQQQQKSLNYPHLCKRSPCHRLTELTLCVSYVTTGQEST